MAHAGEAKIERVRKAEALPEGARVRFRKKGETLWEAGTLNYWWWACDALAANVITDDGGDLTIIPDIGDELEAQS